MPGKILDIMVEENSDIKQGEAIIILEAMKMQNEILANGSHCNWRQKPPNPSRSKPDS
jgi:acetyl/propionyl-CoA carboxylase alpha subunit